MSASEKQDHSKMWFISTSDDFEGTISISANIDMIVLRGYNIVKILLLD